MSDEELDVGFVEFVEKRRLDLLSRRVLQRSSSCGGSMPAQYFLKDRTTIVDVVSVVTTYLPIAGGAVLQDPVIIDEKKKFAKYTSPLRPRSMLLAMERGKTNAALLAERRDFFLRLSERRQQRGDIERYAAQRIQSRWRCAAQLAKFNSVNFAAERTAKRRVRAHLRESLESTQWAVTRTDLTERFRVKQQGKAVRIQAVWRRKLALITIKANIIPAPLSKPLTAAEEYERRARRPFKRLVAAELLQTVWRRHTAKLRVDFRRRRLHFVASTIVQRTARRYLALRRVSSLRRNDENETVNGSAEDEGMLMLMPVDDDADDLFGGGA